MFGVDYEQICNEIKKIVIQRLTKSKIRNSSRLSIKKNNKIIIKTLTPLEINLLIQINGHLNLKLLHDPCQPYNINPLTSLYLC